MLDLDKNNSRVNTLHACHVMCACYDKLKHTVCFSSSKTTIGEKEPSSTAS